MAIQTDDRVVTRGKLGIFWGGLKNILSSLGDAIDSGSVAISNLTSQLNSKANISDLTAHSGNGTIHVTSTNKTYWNGKADKSDIPSSLPADGGNADTVDNKHASDFASAGHTHSFANITNLSASASKWNDMDPSGKYLSLSGGDITGNVHITGSLTNGGVTNGQYVLASGRYSHAEGAGSISSGESSHAEGKETKAIGGYSHAEGFATEAQGQYSHAEGDHTIATQENQLVIGQYNDTSNISNKLFVIGNGSYESSQSYQPGERSNAFTVDKWGNVDIPAQSMFRGTASYALNANNVQNAVSASYATSASFAENIANIRTIEWEVHFDTGEVEIFNVLIQ